MAVFTLNGIPVQVASPINIEQLILETQQVTEGSNIFSASHGDLVRALSFSVRTDFLTTIEKDVLEEELLATGPASIGGDLFGTAISAYVTPKQLSAGPLNNMWVWTFDVEEVGA